jgi:tetratricopeptide (TPR) repeat protein
LQVCSLWLFSAGARNAAKVPQTTKRQTQTAIDPDGRDQTDFRSLKSLRAEDAQMEDIGVRELHSQLETILGSGKYDQARLLVHQYKKQNICKESFYIRVSTAFCYFRLYEDARKILTEGLARFPKSINMHFMNARLWAAAGEPTSAESEFRYCLAIDPRSEILHAELAQVLDQEQELEMALKEIDLALTCNSKNADSWFTKGTILSDMGRTAEALTAYNRSVALDPSHSYELRKKRGMLLEKLGRPADAIKDYDYLIQNNPHITYKAWLNKGRCFLALKKPDEALKNFDLQIEHNPDNLAAHKGRLAALKALGNLAASAKEEKMVESLIEANPWSK